jgi:hypothetical protein
VLLQKHPRRPGCSKINSDMVYPSHRTESAPVALAKAPVSLARHLLPAELVPRVLWIGYSGCHRTPVKRPVRACGVAPAPGIGGSALFRAALLASATVICGSAVGTGLDQGSNA